MDRSLWVAVRQSLWVGGRGSRRGTVRVWVDCCGSVAVGWSLWVAVRYLLWVGGRELT